MSQQKYKDSSGRKLSRPRSIAVLPALVMAVMTTVIAVLGANTFLRAAEEAQPEYEVKIVVEGSHDWNISQETVEASIDEPILSHRPLTLTVTDRWLTGDELLRGELPDHDILLSTQLEKLTPDDLKVQQRFAGTAVRADLAAGRDPKAYDAWDIRFEISNAFRDNLGLGHGPKAVVAAAQRSAIVLYNPPNTNPVFWLSLIGLSATATAVFLLISVRYSMRWQAKYRRLVAAQRKLARVVLDLEALEATYQAAPESLRPKGFQNSWSQLQKLSLELARGEDELVQSIFSRKAWFEEETTKRLSEFETTARRLTGLSDALMGAGSVHARLIGTGSTFDRLSMPVNDAMNRLLVRLERAPGRMVSNEDIERLRMLLGQLLDVASKDPQRKQNLDDWRTVEQQLVRLVTQLKKRIARYPHGKVVAPAPATQEYRELRASLGIDTAIHLDGYANVAHLDALVRAVTGETLETDKAESVPSKSRAAISDAFYRPRMPFLVLSLVGILVLGMIPAGIIAAQLTEGPVLHRDGTGRGAQLEIDDPSGELSETEISRYLDTDFPVPTTMVVAVRDAEAYLDLYYPYPDSEYRAATPISVLKTLFRIKQEFPELIDPFTKELNSGKAIIPVFYTDEGKTIALGLISPEVSAGKYTIRGASNWEYGSIHESRYSDVVIANAIDNYSEGIARNGFEEDTSISFGGLFWLLTFLFFFTVINIVLTARFLMTATGTLGRWGRGTAELRAARKKLNELLLGLDESQINAVAVLGSSPTGRADDAGQRLFERALAMALREESELQSTPLVERMRREFSSRVAHLEQLTKVLSVRDADVARRAKSLVDATRGAGGDEPKDVLLPGE